MAARAAKGAKAAKAANEALTALVAEAADCTRCDLYQRATQTVFGEGDATAAVLLVGEQPGDQEDRSGHPFVGPAGGVLDAALAAAGVPRQQAWVTNAVKHFKWTARGRRRIHDKPATAEIEACHTWLEREIELVEPEVVVCLGATAARAVLGKATTISKVRGQVLDGPGGQPVVVTIHPSAVLRAPDGDRAGLRAGLASDLRLAWSVTRSR